MIPSRSQTAGGGGRRAVGATSRSNGRIRPYLPPACFLVLAFAFVTAAERADGAGASSPGSESLLSAQHDDANWILPAKTYSGNRYTSLSQIDKTNVGSIGMAWRTDIADDGEQEAAPIVWNGVMYLSTPHDGVLALDAGTGKLHQQNAQSSPVGGQPRDRLPAG